MMRFLVDECIGPAVAEWLRRLKHEVFSVYDEARGLDKDLNWLFEMWNVGDYRGIAHVFQLNSTEVVTMKNDIQLL